MRVIAPAGDGGVLAQSAGEVQPGGYLAEGGFGRRVQRAKAGGVLFSPTEDGAVFAQSAGVGFAGGYLGEGDVGGGRGWRRGNRGRRRGCGLGGGSWSDARRQGRRRQRGSGGRGCGSMRERRGRGGYGGRRLAAGIEGEGNRSDSGGGAGGGESQETFILLFPRAKMRQSRRYGCEVRQCWAYSISENYANAIIAKLGGGAQLLGGKRGAYFFRKSNQKTFGRACGAGLGAVTRRIRALLFGRRGSLRFGLGGRPFRRC